MSLPANGAAKLDRRWQDPDGVREDAGGCRLSKTTHYADENDQGVAELAKLRPEQMQAPLNATPNVFANGHARVQVGDIYHFHRHSEPEEIQMLGLCFGSAPLIDADFFIGRARELDQIRNILKPDGLAFEQRRLLLGGLGGIGKTQLAISYARNYQSYYTSIFWLNATSKLTLKASFRSVAQRLLTLAELKNLDDEDIRQTVLYWLSNTRNTQWLLIFDNYDDPNLYIIEEYFPNTAHGSIIITTRLPELVRGQQMQQIRVQSIRDLDESLQILQTRSQRDKVQHDVDARRLAERLAGFPLALATAGAYLSKTTVTFGQYLTVYEQRFDVSPRRPIQLQEYQDRTLYTTWDLTYSLLQQDDELAARTLQLLAYFGNQQICHELLRAGLQDKSPDWLNEIAGEKIDFDNVMLTLVDYCLVEAHSATQSYSMHNCVHDWTLAQLNKSVDPHQYWYAVECVLATVIDEKFEALNKFQYARLVPHALRLTHNQFLQSTALQIDARRKRDLLYTLATLLHEQSQLAAADQVYIRVLAEMERTVGFEHIDTLILVRNIGTLYHDQDRLDEAEQMYTRVLAGFEKALGPNHSSTLAVLNNLGALYQNQDKFDEAERVHLRVLDASQKAFGPKHISTIHSFDNLGVLYTIQGKLDQAEQLLDQVLATYEELLGLDHVATLRTVRNLGILYRHQSKLDQAERMYKRALAGFEKALEPTQIDIIWMIMEIGFLYASQGKEYQAEQMLQRALAGYEKTLGLKHVNSFDTLRALGHLYTSQGRYSQAVEIFSRACSIFQGGNDKNRLCDSTRELIKVLAMSIRVSNADLRSAKHRLASLVSHIDPRNDEDCYAYWLARALLWVEDEENILIAFSKVTMCCDSCTRETTFSEGYWFCCQCKDVDLCYECFAKRAEKSFILPECEGHEYYDTTSLSSKFPGSRNADVEIDTGTWIAELKRKYPSVT